MGGIGWFRVGPVCGGGIGWFRVGQVCGEELGGLG